MRGRGWIPSECSSGQGGTMDCYKKLEWSAEPVTLDDVVENNIWAVFKQFQVDFERVFVLYFWWGFVQSEDPWPNSLKTANIIVPRFCFGRESCFCYFRRISRRFWRGSLFCTFGGVLYKTKTLAKFVENRNCYRPPLLLWSRIMFLLLSKDFEGFRGDFEGGLRFVLLVGFCTKLRPLPNSLKPQILSFPASASG